MEIETWSGFPGRQQQAGTGSWTAILKHQRTAMELSYLTRKGESQPGAFLAGVRSWQGIEALENPLADKVGDAGAFVTDVDGNAVILRMDIDSDFAALRRELDGIAEQIVDCLAYQEPVTTNCLKFAAVERYGHMARFTFQRMRLNNVFCQRFNSNRLRMVDTLAFFQCSELQQLAGEIIQTVGFLHNGIGKLGTLVRRQIPGQPAAQARAALHPTDRSHRRWHRESARIRRRRHRRSAG